MFSERGVRRSRVSPQWNQLGHLAPILSRSLSIDNPSSITMPNYHRWISVVSCVRLCGESVTLDRNTSFKCVDRFGQLVERYPNFNLRRTAKAMQPTANPVTLYSDFIMVMSRLEFKRFCVANRKGLFETSSWYGNCITSGYGWSIISATTSFHQLSPLIWILGSQTGTWISTFLTQRVGVGSHVTHVCFSLCVCVSIFLRHW